MKKINEIGIGSFRPGREPHGKHKRSNDLMGPTSNADSVISQRMQYNVGNYEYDEDISYKGLGDVDVEEEEESDTILECRVYRNGKFQLIETLNNINEIYLPDQASKFAQMVQKINSRSAKSVSKTNDLESLEDKIQKNEIKDLDEEDNLDEFSGGGIAGVQVPVGHTSKGKPETPTQRRRRQEFNITRSFPYTRLANPPRQKRKK